MREREFRQELIERVNRAANQHGAFSREELLRFDIGRPEPFAVIDYSRGIRNPQSLRATLSVVSSATGPYQDVPQENGLMTYHYRAGGTEGDNRKLRVAYEERLPIILFYKPQPNYYVPIAPVYVVADDPVQKIFTLALDEVAELQFGGGEPDTIPRSYMERIVQQRLHQPMFRGIVLRAYEVQCAVCRFRHGELLDAAHIMPDRHAEGHAVVTNGMALCKMHHAAYDGNFLGISGDYKVHINQGLLEEVDGPMLRHGLQEMHGASIVLPKQSKLQPKRESLDYRFATFLRAG